MRSILVLFFVITVFVASAQKENIPATESFSIEGKVKKSLTVALLTFQLTNLILSTALLLLITWEKEKAV